jgi:DNA-binding ferritin-like protein (Dps family)
MKNIIELLIGNLRDKAEYNANRKLLMNLPEDYQYVYKAIEKFMYNLDFDGKVYKILMDVLEAFAIAANEKKPVLSITGEDIVGFCDNLIKKFNVKTWHDKQRDELRKKIDDRFKINNNYENIMKKTYKQRQLRITGLFTHRR